jgi:YgiT-type zinc finger domain-containing protein
MRCTICKSGDVVPGTTTVTLERGRTIVVIKTVPAGVCANCGEEYVDEQTTRRLMDLADAAALTGAQVEVRQFAA